MQKIALGLIVFGLVMAFVKYLDHRGDQEVIAHQTEMAKKSVDSLVASLQQHLPVTFGQTKLQYANTQMIKVEKVNDFTIKHTLQMNGYDSLDASRIVKDISGSLIGNICSNTKMRNYINVGMVHRYEILRANGEPIGSFDADKQACVPYTS